jgi:hypothetical protein
MSQSLSDYLSALGALTAADRQAVVTATKGQVWIPNPGPQTEAFFGAADELLYGGQGGGGKALALDTPLPMPTGWTTMGDVSVGDTLFDDNGQPCRVTATSPVMLDHRCYRVRFSDGSKIVADAEHRWQTLTASDRDRLLRIKPEWRARRRASRPSRGKGKRPDLSVLNASRPYAPVPVTGSVKTTEEIAGSLYDGREINHSIAVCGALACDPLDFPVDPYVFGVWLGDGNTASSAVTTTDADIVESLAAAGYGISYRAYSPITYGVTGGLQAALRRMGVLGNKHIPATYLRGAKIQRLALLQGLMDTDGYCDERGHCEFTTTRKVLSDGVIELIRSLGIKAAVTEGWATLGGRRIGRKYRIKFLTALPAFRLPRKLIRQKRGGFRGTHERRYIVSVEPVESVPVKCVAVDSPHRLYLAGRAMIPTHNTDLLAGLALTRHKRSLLMRPQYTDLSALIERVVAIAGTRQGLNQQPPAQFKHGGRVIDFGAAATLDRAQTWQGNPHDLIGIDEACQFIEAVVRFILGWNRAAHDDLDRKSSQRTRSILASNPPLSAEGQWIVGMFRPWLDPNYHPRAGFGELRWFVTDPDGRDMEVDGPDDCREWEGKVYRPKSRTFIPAALGDNPFLIDTGYQATLDAMPEPMRSAIRDGNFMAAREDSEFQVIKTAWVLAAEERWAKGKPDDVPMSALGLDVARGGRDQTVLSPRYGVWFDNLICVPGRETPNGPAVAGLVAAHLRDGAPVNVDSIGIGAAAEDALANASIGFNAINGAAGSARATRDGAFHFVTRRSELWWCLREALDPDYGMNIALPPDPALRADLTAPTFTVRRGEPPKIYVESKEDIIKRLGRSPDRGDAVVYAWAAGDIKKKRKKGQGLNFTRVDSGYDHFAT